MNKTMVVVKDLNKSFKLPHEQHSGIKQAIINIFKSKRGYEKQDVLKEINFEIQKGEFFGIVGKNGSGKSTLLKILAGIYAPDAGLVNVQGTLTPFIELGVGFNPELTGRENVFMNGALLGFGRQEMSEMYTDIVTFAELEKFMDQKLKNYSSGMQVRLAFSIAIRAKTDILLIDEVLAVGDAAFQAKCFEYFSQLKKSDTTVIFVSHDRSSLERFCDRGILIDKGEITEYGPITKVLKKYTEVVLEQMQTKEDSNLPTGSSPYAKLESIRITDDQGTKTHDVKFGHKSFVEVKIQCQKDIDNPIPGITIWQKGTGKAIFAANNLTENLGELGKIKKGSLIKFTVQIPQYLNDGEYDIEVGMANESITVYYLKEEKTFSFKIFGSHNPHSLVASAPTMKINIQE